MSILDVFKQVCPVIGLKVPDAVFSSQEREHVELQAVANKLAKRIAFDGHDWTRLKETAVLTGNGIAEGFDLPLDYKRMLKKARLWPSSSPYVPMVHYPDNDTWLGLTVQQFNNVIGAYTFQGDQILIKPVVPTGSTVKFLYITDNIVKSKDGVRKKVFTDDTDVFRLDERVLELGIVWQWKANKGLQYAEDMASYEDALSMAAGNDKGSNILTVGRQRSRFDTEMAFPGVIVR